MATTDTKVVSEGSPPSPIEKSTPVVSDPACFIDHDKTMLTKDEFLRLVDEHEKWFKNRHTGTQLNVKDQIIPTDLLELSARVLCDSQFTNVDFGEVDIRKTKWFDAQLVCCDFSKVKNLNPGLFGGADISFSKFADTPFKPGIDNVAELSKNCGAYMVAVITACAYVAATIWGISDAALLTDSSTATLPFLQTQVDTTSFVQYLALLFFGITMFFWLNMQMLWDALSKLPARMPDGQNIDDATYPWIANSVIRFFAPRHCKNRTNVDWFVTLGVLSITFGLAPAVLYYCWRRCLVAYDTHLSEFQIFPTVLVIWNSARFLALMVSTLQHKKGAIDTIVKPFSSIKATVWLVVSTIPFALFGYVWLAISNAVETTSIDESSTSNLITAYLHDVKGFRKLFGAKANLERVELSTRPQFLAVKTKSDCLSVHGANISANLIGADCRYSYLVNAVFKGATLDQTDFSRADMRGANLDAIVSKSPCTFGATSMQWLSASNAQLVGCNFHDADLGGAYLYSAILDKSNFQNAQMQSIFLDLASLTSADLTGANLQGASMNGTCLYHANLSNVQLNQLAYLDPPAHTAYVISVSLDKADLRGANLRGAVISKDELPALVKDGADLKKNKPQIVPNPKIPADCNAIKVDSLEDLPQAVQDRLVELH